MNSNKSVEFALQLLRGLPKVGLNNLRDMPHNLVANYAKRPARRGQNKGGKCGRGDKGQGAHHTLPKIGFDGAKPSFYQKMPNEPYNRGIHARRQYPPLSLLQLQRLIDLGWIDTRHPIDLASICRTQLYRCDPTALHCGVNLTDEGADCFSARINIEVQTASLVAIAAIERAGGVITTRYFDPVAVNWLVNAKKMFLSGQAIPKCLMPPRSALEYYMEASNRGYLAEPALVEQCRQETAQKFGYQLAPLSGDDPLCATLTARKDPRQIFYGLEPGWVVSLTDRTVLRPLLQPERPEQAQYADYMRS